MFIIYARHYLTPEGIEFFLNAWLPNVKKVISRQPGFVYILYDSEKSHGDCVHLTIEFENEALLKRWLGEPEHDPFIDELNPYRSRNYREVARTNDVNINSDKLQWERIEIK